MASASRQLPNGLKSAGDLKIEVEQGVVALEQSRTRLRDQTRILKSVFSSMNEGVVVVDRLGKRLLANHAAELMVGLDQRDVAPEKWAEVYGFFLSDQSTLCPAHEFPLVRVMRGQRVDDAEFFIRNPQSGEERWVNFNSRPLLDDRGTVLGGIAVIRDISEHKRAREIVAEQQRELERSNRDLEQFAYAASHDLQEPLRAVSGYCQLLQRRYKGQLDVNAQRYIAEAVNGARRMQALIEGLLAYSRVARRGNPIVPTDSQTAFDQALVNLEAAIGECGAVITHDRLPLVAADSMQLMLLFQNLIGNALKYRGADPPRIHVKAEERETDWLFSVQDNGIGIDPRHHEKIFLIFQRLHTRNEYPGMGIGLAICLKIVERHGGHLWVESEPGQGSTFFFNLLRPPQGAP
jgi:PAS domain S-box-containing protein